MGEFPSGQRGQTVNLLSVTSVVRIHLPPPGTSQCLHRLGFFLFSRQTKKSSRHAPCRLDIVSISIFLFLRVLPSRGGALFSFLPGEKRTAAGDSIGSGEGRSKLQCALQKHKVSVSKLKISQDSCCVKNNLTRILLN